MTTTHTHASGEHAPQHFSHHYGHLAIMAGLSFVAMYGLMYAMVNAFDNVYNNINQAYMAGLMSAPMVMIELAVMRSMYRNKTLNIAFLAASAMVLVGCWFLIRQQTAVGDKQFLRSMIPHHAGALLMCAEADLNDPEIKALCESIKVSQQSEIDQMTRILGRLSDK